MELRVKRAPRIDTEITVPGDKSISHRAAIIAALSNGVCALRGFLPSKDCMHTVNALRALGIKIEQPEPDTLIVHGKKRVLTPPKEEIDCGNSGTTMRLLAGLLAGQTFESRLVGEAALSRRPMDRVITPLRKMGANIVAEGPEQTPPLRIHGGSLCGIHYKSPIASAQVKSAVLLAGLFAKGKTTVDEPSASRNHTELMFNYFLVRTAKDGDGSISVFGDQVPESRDFTIPGDISSAAFWLVAAAAQPGGHLLVRHIGLNDTRTALLVWPWLLRWLVCTRTAKPSFKMRPVCANPIRASKPHSTTSRIRNECARARRSSVLFRLPVSRKSDSAARA